LSTPLRERPDAPLGTLIFRAGLLPAETIESALEEGVKTGKRLGEILTERGLLKEADLARLLAGQRGLDFVTLREQIVDQTAAGLLSEDQARLFRALPYAFDDGTPVVAIADPTDDVLTRNVREALGRDDAKFVVSVRSELAEIIGRVYADGVAPALPEADRQPETAPAYEPVQEPAFVSEPVPSAEPAPAPEPATEAPAQQPVAEAPILELATEGYAPGPVADAPPAEPVQQLPVAEPVAEVPAPEPVAEAAPLAEPVADVVPTPETYHDLPPGHVPYEQAFPAPQAPQNGSSSSEQAGLNGTQPSAPVAPSPEPVPVPAPAAPATEPAQPVPHLSAPEPAPAPEPLVGETVQAELQAAAPEAAPAPVEEYPVAPAAVEPEQEGSTYTLSVRLTNGERIEVGAYGSLEAAKQQAKALMAQVAAADAGDWPFVSGRFIKPDTIVSVDIL
jgi:hypothetical protein